MSDLFTSLTFGRPRARRPALRARRRRPEHRQRQHARLFAPRHRPVAACRRPRSQRRPRRDRRRHSRAARPAARAPAAQRDLRPSASKPRWPTRSASWKLAARQGRHVDRRRACRPSSTRSRRWPRTRPRRWRGNEVRCRATALAARLPQHGGRSRSRPARRRRAGRAALVDEINNLVGADRRAQPDDRHRRSAETALHASDEQGASGAPARPSRSTSTSLDRDDGGVDITIGNGRPLVVGDDDYPIDEVGDRSDRLCCS